VPTSTGTAFAAAPARVPRARQERLARIYDEQIHPLLDQRLAEMLLAAADLRPHASVLEVGCAAGALTAQLAHRLDGESRLVAVDGSNALLELARARVRRNDSLGRRVFFRNHPPRTRLPFAEETYDVVLANVDLSEMPDLGETIADYARVARPGGQVVVASPLRGTWLEFLDLFREVLIEAERLKPIDALASYVERMPDADAVARQMEAAGLRNVDIEVQHWELVFRSAREFFYAPIIEQGPLDRWKEVVGRDSMQETFIAIKDTIDTYFAGRAFAVSVFGGRFSARKP
jgi:ubiquinone/menaquinone biosynthesis C-methylase UbiE